MTTTKDKWRLGMVLHYFCSGKSFLKRSSRHVIPSALLLFACWVWAQASTPLEFLHYFFRLLLRFYLTLATWILHLVMEKQLGLVLTAMVFVLLVIGGLVTISSMLHLRYSICPLTYTSKMHFIWWLQPCFPKFLTYLVTEKLYLVTVWFRSE